MNEIIALQKYENEAQLAKELIRGFWLAHGDYVITDEEAAENLAAWTDKGHVFYFLSKLYMNFDYLFRSSYMPV